MSDQVILGILPKYHYRFSIVDLTETSREIAVLHQIYSAMSVFLSKTMMGALFLAEMTKNQQRVSIQWKDETNLSVLAYSNRYGVMKAVAYGDVHESGDIRNEFILGQGIMKVIRWQSDGNFYQSYTNLIEDSFESNFLKYLTESEQVKGIIGMDVFPYENDGKNFQVKGFMLQALPEATDDDYNFLNEKIKPIILKERFWKLGVSEMLSELTIAIEAEMDILSTESPEFLCDCSRLKVSEIIKSLGKTEADDILVDVGKVEITCEFCKKAYQFNDEEVNNLFADD